MQALLAPEVSLLLASTRPNPGPGDEAVIRQLLKDGVDWTGFAREAVRQGLAPIAGHSLIRTASDLVPEEIRNAFGTMIDQTAKRNRLLFGELANMTAALGESDIETIAFHGPLRALQSYGGIGFCDVHGLDLFLQASDLAEAIAVLRDLGYVRQDVSESDARQAGQERLVKSSTKVAALLHTQLVPGDLALEFDGAGLWQRSQQTEWEGRSLPIFAPEDDLLILAVRNGARMWRQLQWACDAAGFVGLHRQLDWTVLITRARAQGCHRLLLLAGALMHKYFDAPLPEAILAAANADPAMARMVNRIPSYWNPDKTPDPPSTIDQLALHDGIWRRVRYLARTWRASRSIAAQLPSGQTKKPPSIDAKTIAVSMPQPDELLSSPEFFPRRLEHDLQTLTFVQMSRETYRQSPFLDRRTVCAGPHIFSADLPQLLPAIARGPSSRPLHYIMHGALCGSTLLARYLEALPHCFVLKEPQFLGELAALRIQAARAARLQPEAWADWLGVAATLLARTYPGDLCAVIKTSDLCNWMGDMLLDHDQNSKVVFLTSPLRQFLMSVLKLKSRRKGMHSRMDTLRGAIAQVPFLAESAAIPLNDAQTAAAIWLYNNHLCASWLERPDRSRILPLSSVNFFANPKHTVQAVADFFNLSGDEATRAALAKFEPLDRHSKNLDVPFSTKSRADILSATERQFGAELEDGLAWARRISADCLHPMPFPVE